jgi:hypothetical protein
MNSSRFFGRYIRFGVAFFFSVLLIVAVSGPVMAQFGVQFDDQESESGDAESETDIGIDGNNNNQCVGLLQFSNTGNFSNQQGWTGGDGFFDFFDNDDGPYDDRFRDDDDGDWEIDIEGPEITFAPENETTCEQTVQQASSASSVTYNYYFDGWYFWWWDPTWAGWWYSSDLVNWYWNG